jgi:hypothetical protein
MQIEPALRLLAAALTDDEKTVESLRGLLGELAEVERAGSIARPSDSTRAIAQQTGPVESAVCDSIDCTTAKSTSLGLR